MALAAALVVAFVAAPATLASSQSGGEPADEQQLTESFRQTFVEYWRAGNREYSPDLQAVVEYWSRYHVVKAAIAAVLLVVLVALVVLLSKALIRTAGLGIGRRAALAAAGILTTMLALFALVTVMANIQGAAAPFASLLPLLVGGPADAELATALEQIRQHLADSANQEGQTVPALDRMIEDFDRYHVAMAGIASVVAIILVGTSVALWRAFAKAASPGKSTRRVLASFAVLTAMMSLIMIVVALANTSTAADPVPALLAFFNGGR